MGTSVPSTGQFINGLIDELAIYKRTFTAEEVAVHYTKFVTDPSAPAPPVLNPAPSVVGTNTVVLSGTKPANTAIWVNNRKIALADAALTWQGSYTSLQPGLNILNVTTLSFDTSYHQSSPVTVNVIYDNVPPTGTMTINGGATVTNATQVQLTFSATDANGMGQMQFSNDGTTWSSPEAYATTKAWTIPSGDGAKKVYARFSDVVGNWSNAVNATITLDTTLPVVTATPAGGVYGKGQSVTLSPNKAGSAIYFTTDGSTPTTASAVYSRAISLTGSTTLKFFAKDAAGNLGAIKTESYVIDTLPPVLGISTLSDGASTNNGVLNVAGTVTDDTGVQGLTINGTAVTVDADGSFSYAVALQNGSNTIITVATDPAGNQTSDTRTITYDQVAPTIDVTSPADNAKTVNALLTVTGSVSKTATVTVALGDNVQTAAMDGNTFAAQVTLVPGYNTIEMTATDPAGNISTVKRTILFDDQKPSVAITDPNQDIRTDKSTLTIRGTASDPVTAVTVTVSFNGQVYSPPVIDGTFSQMLTFSAQQSYPIVVTATNEVGTSTSVQRNIIFDTTPPTLGIDAVTNPTSQASQTITGTMESGATVAVTCPTATVDSVTYPTPTTWSAAVSGLAAGNNDFAVNATDAAGNVTTTTVRIIYDVTPPTGSVVISGGATATNSIQAALTLSAADPSGVSMMSFSSDGTTWSDPEPYATTKGWTLSPGDGAKSVYVRFSDTVGNWSGAFTAWITLDTVPPPAPGIDSIPSPINAVSKTVTGTRSSDSTSVVVTCAGATPGPVSYPTATSWSVNISGLKEGANTVTACALDAAGNQSGPVTMSFIVDATPPAKPVVAQPASPTRSGSVTFSWSKDAETYLYVNNQRTSASFAETTGSYTTNLSEGSNNIVFYAQDAAGNASQTTTITVLLDTKAPVMDAATPAVNAVVRSAATITVHLSDATSGVDLPASLTGAAVTNSSGAAVGGSWSVSGANLVFTPAAALADDRYTVTVNPTDLAGNSGGAAFSFTLDTVPPLSPTIDPITVPLAVTSKTITGTKSTDSTSVQVGCAGATVGTVTYAATSWSVTLWGLKEGSNTVIASAFDAAGNQSSASSMTFVVDMTPPAVPTVNPVVSPVRDSPVTLTGTKEANSSLYLNGQATAAPFADTAWSSTATLVEGDNTFVVYARDAAGNQSPSVTTTVLYVPQGTALVGPSPPVNLTAAPLAGGKILFTWQAGAMGTPVGYNLYEVPASFTALTDPGVRKVNSALIADPVREYVPADDTPRFYVVTAVDGGGIESAASAAVAVASDRGGPAVDRVGFGVR